MTDSILIDDLDTFELHPADRCEGKTTDADVIAGLVEERDLLRKQLHDARNELMRIPLLEIELEIELETERKLLRLYEQRPVIPPNPALMNPVLRNELFKRMDETTNYYRSLGLPRLHDAPPHSRLLPSFWFRAARLTWREAFLDAGEGLDSREHRARRRRAYWGEFIAGRDHLTDAEVDEAIAAAQEAVVFVRAEDAP